MSIFSYNTVARSKIEYSNRKILQLIIIIKRSTNERAVEKAKVDLIFQLHKIIVKNVNNFYNLIKNIEKEPLHEPDDLLGECYFVLQKCVRDFKIEKGKYFYWYYNKALTRAMIRIIEKNYYKHTLVDFVNEEYVDSTFLVNPNQESGLVDFYMEMFDLNDQERRVLRSKMNKEKIEDFVKENKDISWNKYFPILASVRKKLEPLRQELSPNTDGNKEI